MRNDLKRTEKKWISILLAAVLAAAAPLVVSSEELLDYEEAIPEEVILFSEDTNDGFDEDLDWDEAIETDEEDDSFGGDFSGGDYFDEVFEDDELTDGAVYDELEPYDPFALEDIDPEEELETEEPAEEMAEEMTEEETEAVTEAETQEEGETHKGECGVEEGTLFWELDGKGTLHIYGEGAMADFDTPEDVPWNEFADDVFALDILDGIDVIGSYAFSSCNALKAVTIG